MLSFLFGKKKKKVVKKKIVLSKQYLQRLVKKYCVSKSGSNKQVARNLWKLRHHVMYKRDLKKIEDYLKIPESKRYKGKRKTIKIRCKYNTRFGKKRRSIKNKMKKNKHGSSFGVRHLIASRSRRNQQNRIERQIITRNRVQGLRNEIQNLRRMQDQNPELHEHLALLNQYNFQTNRISNETARLLEQYERVLEQLNLSGGGRSTTLDRLGQQIRHNNAEGNRLIDLMNREYEIVERLRRQ